MRNIEKQEIKMLVEKIVLHRFISKTLFTKNDGTVLPEIQKSDTSCHHVFIWSGSINLLHMAMIKQVTGVDPDLLLGAGANH